MSEDIELSQAHTGEPVTPQERLAQLKEKWKPDEDSYYADVNWCISRIEELEAVLKALKSDALNYKQNIATATDYSLGRGDTYSWVMQVCDEALAGRKP